MVNNNSKAYVFVAFNSFLVIFACDNRVFRSSTFSLRNKLISFSKPCINVFNSLFEARNEAFSSCNCHQPTKRRHSAPKHESRKQKCSLVDNNGNVVRKQMVPKRGLLKALLILVQLTLSVCVFKRLIISFSRLTSLCPIVNASFA